MPGDETWINWEVSMLYLSLNDIVLNDIVMNPEHGNKPVREVLLPGDVWILDRGYRDQEIGHIYYCVTFSI